MSNFYTQRNGNRTNRAGLQPNQQSIPYSVKTSQVEDYLQKKLDSLYAKAGRADESFNIKVYTTEISRKFQPFIVVLPMEALKDHSEEENSKIDPFFRVSDDNRCANLDDLCYGFFKNYIYDKDDQNAFFSEAFRRQMALQKDNSALLKSLRNPKITEIDNGRVQLIIFMIDPIRVFHDMLTEEEDKREFYVNIRDTKKINTGEFVYTLKRELKNGKNKDKCNKKSIIGELEGKLRSQMRR